MGKKTYPEYWKMVRSISKDKAKKKLGITLRVLAIIIGVVSTAATSILFGGNFVTVLCVALATIFINIFIWGVVGISLFVYYRAHEPVVIYNDQVSELDKLNKSLNPIDEIIITPFEDGEFECKNENVYKVARMKIFNNAETKITKCYVTLQSAEDVFIAQGESRKIVLIPSLGNTHKPDRIRWNETEYMNEQCEMEIPPKDARHIDLADTLGTFHYNLCKGDVEANWLSGSLLHTFIIRIDYSNETNSKFIIFDGYIYAANLQDTRDAFVKDGRIKEQYEVQKDQITYLKMIFKQGDWMDNKEVRDYLEITP